MTKRTGLNIVQTVERRLKMAKESKLQDELDQTLADLAKKYGYERTYTASDAPIVDVPRISVGSLSMDVALCGGLPTGRIVELYGEESSGKSTMALKVIANAQKMGKRAVYIDAEHTFDRDWARLLGVDLDTLFLPPFETAEQACEIVEASVISGKCGVIVIDSIPALVPHEELDKSLVDDNPKIAGRASLLNRAVPRLVKNLNTTLPEGEMNDTLVIYINQLRSKIGVLYGDPTTTPGGWAVKFYSSVRVRMTHGAWVEKDEVKIGHTAKFMVKKNKTAPGGRTGEFTFYFDGPQKGQIDLVDEVFRYGQIVNVINVSGRTYEYGEFKAVGKDSFLALLRENPKVVDAARKEILKVAVRGA